MIRAVLTASLVLAAAVRAEAQIAMPIACTVQPAQVIELAAPFPGVIAEVFAPPGSRVAQGDPIAVLDHALAAADARVAAQRAAATGGLIAARARLGASERKVSTMEKAVAKRAISQIAFDEAVLERDLARAELTRTEEAIALAKAEAARAALVVQKSTIRAPQGGILGPDMVDAGESVDTSPVATIFVTRPLKVEAFVPITRLPDLLSRDQHRAAVIGQTNVTVDLVLDFVSPEADLSSRTVSVIFSLDDDRVMPGSGCQISLEVG